MSHHVLTRRLEIVADSDPTVLSRVSGILANLSLIPDRFQSMIDAEGGTLRVVILTNGWTEREVDMFVRKVSQLAFVRTVCVGAPKRSSERIGFPRVE